MTNMILLAIMGGLLGKFAADRDWTVWRLMAWAFGLVVLATVGPPLLHYLLQ